MNDDDMNAGVLSYERRPPRDLNFEALSGVALLLSIPCHGIAFYLVWTVGAEEYGRVAIAAGIFGIACIANMLGDIWAALALRGKNRTPTPFAAVALGLHIIVLVTGLVLAHRWLHP